jgi:hypothetical protein
MLSIEAVLYLLVFNSQNISALGYSLEFTLQERLITGTFAIGDNNNVETMISIHKKSEIIVSKIENLEALLVDLIPLKSKEAKLNILQKHQTVTDYLELHSSIKKFLVTASIDIKISILSVIVIGEGPIVFRGYTGQNIDELIHILTDIEHFYDTIGGIIGYHLTVLKLIAGADELTIGENTSFRKPEGVDLTHPSQEVRDAVRAALENLPKMGEIYPVGGAGDRLSLTDSETNQPLPAAQLLFCGRTLLEGLIRDLQAREFLYLKLFGKKLITPIALMTSEEKDNDRLVRKVLENKGWFGRPPESFKIFKQPLVPVVTIDGNWSMSDILKPTLKPGGHGVIWKIAEDHGVFEWFAEQKRKKCLVRQINNPIAGTDDGLIAFVGVGLRDDKMFGFASCFRLLNAAEGMVVLVEKEMDGEFLYKISNIEYTNFKQYGIQDVACKPGSPYSQYPANTNILFIDLEKIRGVIKDCPIPGMLVNLKSTAPFIDHDGTLHEKKAGRLETTMQNISDHIYESYNERKGEGHYQELKTYLTYNDRRKTISVTKNSYEKDKSLMETPEGCFYDMLLNGRDLLMNYCHFHVPEIGTEEEYLTQGPKFVFLYHPALGPLYSVISQKLLGGNISEDSELQLEISEIFIKNLHLCGSLLILADDLKGKCLLENVTVKNSGINRNNSNIYWKNEIIRNEDFRIVIKGAGEFIARDVIFVGSHGIEVPDGYRVTASMVQGKISFVSEKIDKPSWDWKYSFDNENKVILSR